MSDYIKERLNGLKVYIKKINDAADTGGQTVPQWMQENANEMTRDTCKSMLFLIAEIETDLRLGVNHG